MPPQIYTYHCICSTLLIASTHTLTSLPRRSKEAALDHSIVLPLPSPSSADLTSPVGPEGYTTLLSLTADQRPTIVRKEDGFERRFCYRCSRCSLVVGYEVQNEGDGLLETNEGSSMEGLWANGVYKGSVLYVMPGGLRSTEGMMREGEAGKITESDVAINARTAVLLNQ